MMRFTSTAASILSLFILSGCVHQVEITPAEDVTISGIRPGNLSFDLPGKKEKLELAGIGKGSFVMGEQMPVAPRYNPSGHKVTITQDFWIGRFELTCGQYAAVTGKLPSSRAYRPKTRLPVMLTRQEATEFLIRLNQLFSDRLPEGYTFNFPTEAQWEYACRAGTTNSLNSNRPVTAKLIKSENNTNVVKYRLVSSDQCMNLDELGWYAWNSNTVKAIGKKMPNSWGLYDMHGNVAEMCLDRFHYNYEQYRYQISSRISNSFAKNKIDPLNQNPVKSPGYVVRGGSVFSYDTWDCTSWARAYVKDSAYAGFRVALTKQSHEQDDIHDKRIFGNTPMQYSYTERSVKRENEYREKMAMILIEGSLKIGVQVVDLATQIDQIAHPEEYSGSTGGGERVSGNGFIRGPDRLKSGQIGRYNLYVQGKKIRGNIQWRAAGTSITVNGNGGTGKAMAGRPPRRNFKTYIEAKYGGRTFRKSITIL